MSRLFIKCKDCEERSLGCHSSCSSYLEAKEIKKGMRMEVENERIYSIIPARDRKGPQK